MITACWFCGGAVRVDRDVLVFSRWVPLSVVLFLSCVDCGTEYLENRDEAGAPVGAGPFDLGKRKKSPRSTRAPAPRAELRQGTLWEP